MILFGAYLPEPQFQDQKSYDLRIVTNYNMDETPRQAPLAAEIGQTLELVVRFKDCDGHLSAIKDGLTVFNALPIGLVTLGKTYLGILLSEPTFTEEKEDLWSLSMTYYVLSEEITGDFILDPDDDPILDPQNLPLESP